jgi:flagellar basal-body rod protein FlgF
MNDLIWLAMSGAQALAHRQESAAHNLANASTVGYRADRSVFRSVPVESGQGAPTRVYALEASAAFDPTPGPVNATGRSLDVAIVGEGWFVVQAADGGDAFTRNGRLEVGPEGALQVAGGMPVMGDGGGPLVVPPNAQVGVGADGTVSARIDGQPPVQLGRLRLVNPPPAQLVRGEDGLMRSVSPDPVPEDPGVRVAEGSLEGSNVNVVESMVGMISLARQYEVQMRLLQNAESNEQRATQLLSPAA